MYFLVATFYPSLKKRNTFAFTFPVVFFPGYKSVD